MRRKSFVSVFVFLVLVVGLGYLWYTAPAKGNTLWVTVSPPLNLEKVVIEKGDYSSGAITSQYLLISDRENVIFDGVIKQTLKTEQGNNDLLLIYDQKLYVVFKQFISDDLDSPVRKANKYQFSIEKKNDRIEATLKISGAINTEVTREMKLFTREVEVF